MIKFNEQPKIPKNEPINPIATHNNNNDVVLTFFFFNK